MTEQQKKLGQTLWAIADQLRGAMNADDFRDYMLAFLFLRYLSDNYERAARRELGRDWPDPDAIGNGGRSSLSVWYDQNPDDVLAFEKQMRRKTHHVIRPEHLWAGIAHGARTRGTVRCSTRSGKASGTSRTSRSRAPSRGCSRRSISAPTSWAGRTRNGTRSSVRSSPGSPTVWRSSRPTETRWGMPAST